MLANIVWSVVKATLVKTVMLCVMKSTPAAVQEGVDGLANANAIQVLQAQVVRTAKWVCTGTLVMLPVVETQLVVAMAIAS